MEVSSKYLYVKVLGMGIHRAVGAGPAGPAAAGPKFNNNNKITQARRSGCGGCHASIHACI